MLSFRIPSDDRCTGRRRAPLLATSHAPRRGATLL